LALALLLAVIGGWWAYTAYRAPDPEKVYIFKGVRGPSRPSQIVRPPAASLDPFEVGGDHRLAVLITDPSAGWLGFVRGFRSRGIPFMLTSDPATALRHRVVLVYPGISGRLPPAALQALAAHVRAGGTLLAFDQQGGGLEDLFGAGDGVASRARRFMTWARPRADPRETTLRIDSSGEDNMGTIGFPAGRAEVLAAYDDGVAAVTCRQVVGRACLMGVDIAALAERAMNGRGEAISRDYVNGYEPSVDILFAWIRDLYVQGETMPWLVSPAPAGRDVSIILTHDIDFTRSVVNAKAYADLLRANGLSGTFFTQTKYLKDWNDDIFFNARTVPLLRGLLAEGMELGSHSVAHSRAFKAFPLGDGHEAYPDYRPFVIDQTHARGGAVLGELRVSRFLLRKETGAEVVSFRPGHLSYPSALPQALAATGYLYSSALPAESTLGYFPYQTTFDRADAALEPEYQFPVAIEDEQAPPLPDRFAAADALIADIAREHGVAVILIHPDVVQPKLGFEARLIAVWRSRAWIGSLRDFGAWWAARDALQVDVAQVGGKWVLSARAGDKPVHDVQISLPKARGGRVTLNLAAGQATTQVLN
jgi:peptidoglycan/xylan/chitin deacetylase (PgdA/CDA1 family)